jgi:hypothetical protein
LPACGRAFREWRWFLGDVERLHQSSHGNAPPAEPRGRRSRLPGRGSPRRAASRSTRAGSQRALSLTHESLPRTELRGHGSTRVASAHGDHIPDPGKHRVHIYGHSASRVRGARAARAEPPTEIEDGSGATTNESGTRRRCPPSWARLIHRVYQADPLVCRRCGGKLKITGYLCDSFAIRRMLEEMGLAPREDKPPPVPTPPREVARVPVDEEGREFTLRSAP